MTQYSAGQWPNEAARLTIPDIEPVMQVRVKFDLEAKDGERVKSELHASIHKLAK